MCKKYFNWGIIGCGSIANKFATSLALAANAKLYAAASRSEEKARNFCIKHGGERWFGSYAQMVEDPGVDAVYVASPHQLHFEHAMLCIDHGKPVLCEKPLTLNAREAEALIAAARKQKVFLMEAFWTRFLPATLKLNQLLVEGIIGNIKLIQADFGYDMPFDASHRSYNPDLAGGALLDVGVYPINFAQMIYRSYPEEIKSVVSFAETGVDEQSAYLFRYAEGRLALLQSAVSLETQHHAWIYGTEGYIHMPEFFHARKLHIRRKDGYHETLSLPFDSTGYSYEAIEVMQSVQKGNLESPLMPHAQSLEVMKIMDHIRAGWGLTYPGEA